MKTTIAAAAAVAFLSLAATASATPVLLTFEGFACSGAGGAATDRNCAAQNDWIGADYGSTTGLAVTYDASENVGSVTSLKYSTGAGSAEQGAFTPSSGPEPSLITFTPAAGYEVSFRSFSWGNGTATFVNYTLELVDAGNNVLFHLEPNAQGSHVANTAYFSGPLTFRFSNGGSGVAVVDNIALDLRGVSTGGVPEPATWAMMLVGFGGMGTMLRRRRAARFA